jgi:hypothetical protein
MYTLGNTTLRLLLYNRIKDVLLSLNKKMWGTSGTLDGWCPNKLTGRYSSCRT